MFSQLGAHLDYIFTDKLPTAWLYPNKFMIKRPMKETVPMSPLIGGSKSNGRYAAGFAVIATVSLIASLIFAPSIPLALITLAALTACLYNGYQYQAKMNELFETYKCELTPCQDSDKIQYEFFQLMSS